MPTMAMFVPDPITGRLGFSGTSIPMEDEHFVATVDPSQLRGIASRCEALSVGPVQIDIEACLVVVDWKLEAPLGWLVDEVGGAYAFYHAAGYQPEDRGLPKPWSDDDD